MDGSNFLFDLIGSAIIAYPAWRIFARAGLQPAWSLTVFVPILGFIIATCILAFSTWQPRRMP